MCDAALERRHGPRWQNEIHADLAPGGNGRLRLEEELAALKVAVMDRGDLTPRCAAELDSERL